jgi:hypothetical protein
MPKEEVEFLEEMLPSTELLSCYTCGEETLHVHEEVLAVLPVATELKMQCTRCQMSRNWIDWDVPQLIRRQS